MDAREYYSKEDVQKALLEQAKDREVQVCFKSSIMGPRPEVVYSLGDIQDLVRQGMTSFHVSVERWKDALRLKSGMSKRELDDLRLGWDLLIDIDSKCLEFSVYAGQLIVELLKFYGIKDFDAKFSGNHGFHVGVCYEAFPSELFGKELKNYFPEGIREIAEHIRDRVREHLAGKILEKYDIDKIVLLSGKSKEELLVNGKFEPFSAVDIDSILISSRHLFRAAYSLNEKSGLVSVPVSFSELMNFDWRDLDRFKPENVVVSAGFLERSASVGGAFQLFDKLKSDRRNVFVCKDDEGNVIPLGDESKREFRVEELKEKVRDEFFPPCMKLLMKGLSEDGRKRAVFVFVNFLRNMGWSFDEIEEYLLEWNSRNYEKLRDGYIISQVSWVKRNQSKMLPPNCSNNAYYKTMGVCCPDAMCNLVKNPVNYAVRKLRLASGKKKRGKGKK